MEFQPGDFVETPKGKGYVNEIIGDEIVVDLIDGDDKREVFEANQINLLVDD